MLLRSTGQTSIIMTMIIAHLRTPGTQTQRTVKSLKPSGPACVIPLETHALLLFYKNYCE